MIGSEPSRTRGSAGAGRCLVLFTKPARPGRVKTRLIGARRPGGGGERITAAGAARLHAAFLDDLCARLAPAVRAGRFRLRLAWALEAGEALPPPPAPLAGLAGADAVRQRGRDLGERLFNALRDAAGEHALVAAVGSDHPTLPLARVEEAFSRAAETAGGPPGGDGATPRVVLGPADDGGYYLIALPAGCVDRRLFSGIAWSTSGVLRDTVAACRAAGLPPAFLAPAYDVDDETALLRLADDLAASDAAAAGDLACPRTRALLAAWGRPARVPVADPRRPAASAEGA